MNPVLITIGNFEIRWYSLLIVTAIIIGIFGVSREAKRFKINENFIINAVFWAIVAGIIGARICYVIFQWSYYKEHLIEIPQIWNGGLAIYGGIILGTITIIIYCRKYKCSSLKILDILCPFVILGQAIGRWGNFFNSEAYGSIVTYEVLKKFKIIPEFVINGMHINGYYHLPMFYFESLWCILGFVILILVRRIKKIREGQIVSIYLMWYSFGRFFIERYRTDSLLMGNLRAAQVTSMVLFVSSIIMFFIFLKKNAKDLYNNVEKVK